MNEQRNQNSILQPVAAAFTRRLKAQNVTSKVVDTAGRAGVEIVFSLDRNADGIKRPNPVLDMAFRLPGCDAELSVRVEAVDQHDFGMEGSPLLVPCRVRMIADTSKSPFEIDLLVEALQQFIEMFFPGYRPKARARKSR